MRTITLNLTPEEYETVTRATDFHKLQEAVSYFTTWAFTSGHFDTVRIFMDWNSKTDLIALYSSTENPDSKFTMGAVWRKDDGKFTFHS